METVSRTSSRKLKVKRRKWSNNSQKILNTKSNTTTNQSSIGLQDIWQATSKDGKRCAKDNGCTSWDGSIRKVITLGHSWTKVDPNLILIATYDSYAMVDLEGGGQVYNGLDYQVKLQLLPVLEKRPGLQFKTVRRCHMLNQGSWLEVECGNKQTYDWLQNDVSIPFTNNQGVFIRFYPANIRYNYIIARLPIVEGCNDRFSMELFRQRCRKQNPSLNTWHWRLINRQKLEGEEGNTFKEVKGLLLEVPEETVQYLDKNYWELFYQLGKIVFEPVFLNEDGSFRSRDKAVTFKNNNLRNKSLLPICPIVQYIHRLEMEKNISENSEEQVIGVTEINMPSESKENFS